VFVRNIKNSFLSIGKVLDGPEFVKDYESLDDVIGKLDALKSKTNDKALIEKIETEQLFIRIGDQGEKNVYYELKNSFVPMYVLHDVRIKEDDYYAQLDYVVVTNKFIMILETKKLNGDVSISNSGDFVRSFKSSKGKVYKKEGMYSPISQNQRHVRIVENILLKNKMIKHAPVLSLVVMANPKSIINYKYAPKEIKNQIIKYDQLTNYLNKELDKASDINIPIVTMAEIAEFLLERHVEEENGFVRKYAQLIGEETKATKKVSLENKVETFSQTIVDDKKVEKRPPKSLIKSSDEIRKALVQFRLNQSRAEGVAAYLIFNNKQMEDIIDKMPKSKGELLKCSGFGKVKVEKYGDEIIGAVCEGLA